MRTQIDRSRSHSLCCLWLAMPLIVLRIGSWQRAEGARRQSRGWCHSGGTLTGHRAHCDQSAICAEGQESPVHRNALGEFSASLAVPILCDVRCAQASCTSVDWTGLARGGARRPARPSTCTAQPCAPHTTASVLDRCSMGCSIDAHRPPSAKSTVRAAHTDFQKERSRGWLRSPEALRRRLYSDLQTALGSSVPQSALCSEPLHAQSCLTITITIMPLLLLRPPPVPPPLRLSRPPSASWPVCPSVVRA